ncbi:MAG: DNA-processing protein DprA [Bacillota bacterium]
MEIYWLWLSMLPGVGPLLQKKLLEKFGSAADVYHAGEGELLNIEGMGEKLTRRLLAARSLDEAARMQEKVQRVGARLLVLTDPIYPSMVKSLPEAPAVLFYRGTMREQSCGVGIVGARRCTPYGKEVTRQAATFLAQHGIPVISGMARGIDSYANTACLQAGGYTLAFLGCGVDICYPAEHRDLMEAIVERGAVLSAYPPGTEARPEYFPRRNFLISAWSYRLLVVEAAKKSGSLITAALALDLGRPVLAVPNSIYSRESTGTNALIAAGAASIYLHPQQLLPLTQTVAGGGDGSERSGTEAVVNGKERPVAVTAEAAYCAQALTAPEREILDLLADTDTPRSAEELAARFNGDKKYFWETLAVMVLEGKVESLPGGRIRSVGRDLKY